jgi:PKD repeat protein
VYQYDHAKERKDAAINGGVFYTGKNFPARFADRLFITDYIRGFIKTLVLDDNGNVKRVEDFATGLELPVHLTQSPDGGLIYVSISTGEIRKIHYVGGKNRPPVAVADASRHSGKTPLTVQFSSKGSHDPDGDPIQFLWDFGDGQTSTAANPQHVYNKKGVYFAVLTVRDNQKGVSVSRSLRLTVGNEPPSAIILQPSNGLVVRAGETVTYSGKGTDPEDGALNARVHVWSAELHHNNHTHPFFSDVRGKKGSFVVPETHESGTLFYRLTLEVTDSAGARTSVSVDLIHQQ